MIGNRATRTVFVLRLIPRAVAPHILLLLLLMMLLLPAAAAEHLVEETELRGGALR
jgi:hypothetical protein